MIFDTRIFYSKFFTRNGTLFVKKPGGEYMSKKNLINQKLNYFPIWLMSASFGCQLEK